MGVFGIYLATLIARATTNLWYEPYAVYKYGLNKSVWIYWLRYVRYMLVLGIAGGISFALCSMANYSDLVNALYKFAVCTFVPNSLFYFFFHKTPEFVYLREHFDVVLRLVFRRRKIK